MLVAAGISTEVRADPILPNVTDDETTFDELCAAIGATGVKRIAASTLFLPPKIRKNLEAAISDKPLLTRLLKSYPKSGRDFAPAVLGISA